MCRNRCKNGTLSKEQYFSDLQTVATIIIGLLFFSWIFMPSLKPLADKVWWWAAIIMAFRYVKHFGLDFIPGSGDHSGKGNDVREIKIDDEDLV